MNIFKRTVSLITSAMIVAATCLLPVSGAKGNELAFAREDGRLYYDSDRFDEDLFLYFPDMLPGQTYSDELTVRNKNGSSYKLWFSCISFEENPKLFELLDSIHLKVTLGDSVVYDGKATGEIVRLEDANIENAIYIGEYAPGTSVLLHADATLDASYSITETLITQCIWKFWARNTSTEPLDPTPETGDRSTAMWWIVAIICAGAVTAAAIKIKRSTAEKL